MCFLCSEKPPASDEPQYNTPPTVQEPTPGPPVVFGMNPYLPPSTNPPMKITESDWKPPKKFSTNTTYDRSPSPVVNSDSDDRKDKKSKKTSSPDRKLASSDSDTYASNPMYSTDHFPAEWNSDSNKPTTRKTGHEYKLSPSPPPEKLNIKSTELSENITRRLPTSDEVTRNTTESPTKARDEQNAKGSNTSSNNKKLMWNKKEHTESPYKDAASSLHYQTAISDSEKDQNIPYW